MADELTEAIQAALGQAFDKVALLRQELGGRLLRECATVLEAATTRASEQAARSARSAMAEALHAAVRRIRLASNVTEIGAALLETASAHCGRAALMVHKGDTLTGWRACGFTGNEFAELLARFQLPVREAPALAHAIETRDAVVALGTPLQLSPALVELFGIPPDEKTYLFPLSLRQTVVAILYADSLGAAGGIQPAALELLCAVSEASIEALSSRRPMTSQARSDEAEPQRLELPVPLHPEAEPPDWNALSPSERDIHLRAQRFARVLVADLQLYRAQEIREGKKMRNLYSRLKDEIDKSREVYYRKFGSTVATGIDYFHLELVSRVSGGEEALLGPDYPGPMFR